MSDRCRSCDSIWRAERAERELRDASRSALARVAELERERDAALIERDDAQHTFRCIEEDERYQDRVTERDAARATVAELVTALAMALDWAECDAKSLAAIEARKRWPDHVPTGFETRVARLRAALAKAKESANG